MSGQDGLRDDIAAALAKQRLGLEWDEIEDYEHDEYRADADAVLAKVQARIDAAREQDLAATETQIAEHVATRVQAAVARAEAAEQAVQRVRELCGTGPFLTPEDVLAALDGTP